MAVWLLLPLTFLVSGFLTWALRRYALAKSMMDIPNARSSHSIPTPRGGGLAIVLAYLAVLPVLGWVGQMSWPFIMSLVSAGGWIALIGFLDDHGHVPARWRLLAHFLGAGLFLPWLPSLPEIHLLGYSFALGWVGYVLAGLFLVWMLNLYNFMDGIDGLASVEAISVCVGGAMLYLIVGEEWRAITPLILAAAVAGFLLWNFPPAKIFMGDAGSGFLGVVLGGFVMQATWADPVLLWAWMILLGVFVVDATFTLFRRLVRGEKIYEAHRSHAYQNASRRYGAHLPVTLAVLAVNLLWLFPWSYVVALGMVDGLIGLLLAYLPLFALAVGYRAGGREE